MNVFTERYSCRHGSVQRCADGMTDRAHALLREALDLSAEERAVVAAELTARLDTHDVGDDEAQQRWVREIERRERQALTDGSSGRGWGAVRDGLRILFGLRGGDPSLLAEAEDAGPTQYPSVPPSTSHVGPTDVPHYVPPCSNPPAGARLRPPAPVKPSELVCQWTSRTHHRRTPDPSPMTMCSSVRPNRRSHALDVARRSRILSPLMATG